MSTKIEMNSLPTMYSDFSTQKELQDGLQHDHNKLTAFVDLDWAGDTSHRRSITGLAVIAYKSRIQKTIALSSMEAE